MDSKKIILIILAAIAAVLVGLSAVMICLEFTKDKAKDIDSNFSSEVTDVVTSSNIIEDNSSDSSTPTVSGVQSNSDKNSAISNTQNNSLVELSFSFPKQNTLITTEAVVNISGNSDPSKPVTVNGKEIERNEDGSFLYLALVNLGKNTFTFKHKNKTYTFTIERQDHNLGGLPPTEGVFLEAKTLKEYLLKGISTVVGSEKDKTNWVYKINSTGIYVRDVDIDLGGKNEYTIAHLTDFHLVAMNNDDLLDPQLAKSYLSRKNSFPDAERNARIAMKYASFFDKTIVTGDAIDYLSVGALDLLNEIIGKTNTLVAMGNHDYRKVWYDTYTDTVPVEERFALCQTKWSHNIHYHSEIIKDKFMIITMNNGAGSTYENYYSSEFTAKDSKGNAKTGTMDKFFADDLKIAKDNGYSVLIFQHSPIWPNSSEPFYDLINGKNGNFGNWYIGSSALKQTEIDKKMYNHITENAKIIKGIFCGHTHENYYTKIKSKASPSSISYDSVIPQYVLGLNARLYGNVIKITVKY